MLDGVSDGLLRARRAELGAFLRARRAELRPRDVGLPDAGGPGRRRTPGLRRSEVAMLAGLSVEYYVRLEQGRGANPSRQVLAALARALLLTRDERDYVFRIAGESPPSPERRSSVVAPSVQHLLAALTATPAFVVDAAYDVLAWNPLATLFVGDLSRVPDDERNMIRWMFRRPPGDPHWSDEDALAFTCSMVADLRAAYARHLGDRALEALVTKLLALSPRFAAMWSEQRVEERRLIHKRVDHPRLGPLEFACQLLLVPATDQRIILYLAAPGSPTDAAFRRADAAFAVR
jgi:transcriptional regulator with XRE-family HTH domain